ncbi:MAG: hypothetical protein NDI81_01835 [Desulfobacula sp.]|nr:hypothetical protein [Desulfobacula sp.]
MAKKLELRLIQKIWRDRSFFAVEKEIFLGFYSIRKLIESNKVSDSVKNKIYQVHEFPNKERNKTSLFANPENEFNFDRATKVSLSVINICNQFIHSYHFVPFIPGGTLIGFFICSDYKKKTGIYLITTFDIVEIYKLVGKNYPYKTVKKKVGNKIHTQIK